MRLVLISDTHMHHGRIAVPPGDVLVHAGDSTKRGTPSQLREVAEFMAAQPHAHKVIIAGNHDFALQDDLELGPELFGSAYLCDAEARFGEVRVWGSPWQPWF